MQSFEQLSRFCVWLREHAAIWRTRRRFAINEFAGRHRPPYYAACAPKSLSWVAAILALPMKVVSSFTTSCGAVMSPRNVQPVRNSQRSPAVMLPSTIPWTTTER